VIGQHGYVDINVNGRLLLQLLFNNALRIMNTFFHSNTEICTSIHAAEIAWVKGRSLVSAYFQLPCSNQCWTFVSKMLSGI